MKSASTSTSSVLPHIPVIGVGASAGGIRALQDLFTALPPKLGAAIVVIVHLDPEHASELASILQLRTSMPVTQVNVRVALQADNVYVIPPDRRLLVSGTDIETAPFEERRGQRAPIDQFFNSLATEYGDGCAVVLSGSGSDGSVGVRVVKEHGGIVLVQDPGEAEFPMMPRAAIAAGADFVLPVEGIAKQLVELVRLKGEVRSNQDEATDDDVMRRILAHIRAKTGQDFALYKRATINRRIQRRMQVVHSDSLVNYLAYLGTNPEEVKALFNDLLISVTSFFRDPQAYKVLADKVIRGFFDRDCDHPIRIWVPGCATGEEAYSIAMLLLEEADRRGVGPACQVFASDLDVGALATARAGRYPVAIEADVSPERLARFFTREGEHYVVRQELRDLVVFAVHGLLKDPPFSRLDMISCRNLMIYLERALQEQACRTFAYALTPGGVLFLGASETADHPAGLFSVVDREARIYRVNEQAGRTLPPLPQTLGPATEMSHIERPIRTRIPAHSDAAEHWQALEQVAPPSMLVDSTHAIVHLSETAGRFLQPSGGQLTNDAVVMVHPDLRLDLAAALYRALEHDERTLTLPIVVRFAGGPQTVALQVTPRKSPTGLPSAVVLFVEGGPPAVLRELEAQPDGSPLVVRLREKLLASQSLVRTMREQYESATEELRAANEELQSINEEYRSTAEELETSKEELQSINEELQTLNNELKLKLDMVTRSNNDLLNLMGATDIATLFLDKAMRIKRFTPRTTELFSVHSGDEGRPISDFTHRLEYVDLVADAERVLAELVPIERTIHTLDERWLTTRLRPYRTVDDKIEGVVVTFFDVTERRQADAAWAARQELLLQEFGHRLKNALAVVQSIVRQTLRGSAAIAADPELADRINNRLQALSLSHDLLLQSEWQSIDLQVLANNQLQPHIANGRIAISGPPVVLDPKLATPLGLVLHELATNAAKYGALSLEQGQVTLSWHTTSGHDDTVLQIIWRERGGPRVAADSEKGLGTALIRTAIPEATAECDKNPLGLTWTLTVPLGVTREKKFESPGVGGFEANSPRENSGSAERSPR